MAKRGRSQQKESKKAAKKRSLNEYAEPQDMDDEIDAFHKQRDVVPLDVDGDAEELSDDDEIPVFDDKAINHTDEDEDDDDGDTQDKGFAAKIARQAKFLRSKFGDLDDEMHDDEEADDEEKDIWSGNLRQYYGGTRDEESEEEEEEEAAVKQLQKERAKHLSLEDFGIEDVSEDESGRELTLQEMSIKGNSTEDLMSKESEEVKKDLNALSRKDQMDVVYSSAPELVGLLSELNDALEQLESRVNPLLSKVKAGGLILDGGIHYLEVKQLLLLAYCQAITFYLLLKSEGQPVRDHPVIARLVEIKGLLDKMNQLDENIPPDFENFLKENHGLEMVENLVIEHNVPLLTTDRGTEGRNTSPIPVDAQDPTEPYDTNKLGRLGSLTGSGGKERKHKQEDKEVGVKSLEMLKLRADLVEKLKQKGVLGSFASKADKAHKHSKPANRQLETYDDFDDDAVNVEWGDRRLSNGLKSSLDSNKLSQLVTARLNKPKFTSGDDDLPKRDDIGERRRKHELRVLASAGIKSEDDAVDELKVDGDLMSEDDAGDSGDDAGESEDDFYKQVEQDRAAKLAAKAELYKRTSAAPSLPETVDGKRQITHQIEKNRGLTRLRKKLTKNPRKKYRTKHDEAKKRRKGQVRDIKKPSGPYGGESSGINPRISRSIRLRN